MYILPGFEADRLVTAPFTHIQTCTPVHDQFGAHHFSHTCPGSARFGLFFRTRRGSVWFGSVWLRIRFQPVPELIGLVMICSRTLVSYDSMDNVVFAYVGIYIYIIVYICNIHVL